MNATDDLLTELKSTLESLRSDIGLGSTQSVLGRAVKRYDRLGSHLKTIELLLTQLAKLTPEESTEPDTEVMLYQSEYLEFLAHKFNHKVEPT